MKVKTESEVAQLCPTLSDPMDCSLPGFSVHGIFQAIVLEWIAISFSSSTSTYMYIRILQKRQFEKESHTLQTMDNLFLSQLFVRPPQTAILLFLFNHLLLLLSRFSRVRLCATPWTAAHQVPPSLKFSRQEHWSGLPFPSPTHESEN